VRARSALGVALLLAWPLLVHAGVRLGLTRAIAALAGALLLVRGVRLARRIDPGVRRCLLAPALVLGLVAASAALLDDPRLLMALPALVSVGLLTAFAATLRGPGPSMAESFARLRVPELSPAEVRYCRGVTALWCAFFAANSALAGGLAAAGALAAWTLWTGLLAYLAMAVLFAAELLVRGYRFRHDYGLPTDRLFRRLFPRRRGEGLPRQPEG